MAGIGSAGVLTISDDEFTEGSSRSDNMGQLYVKWCLSEDGNGETPRLDSTPGSNADPTNQSFNSCRPANSNKPSKTGFDFRRVPIIPKDMFSVDKKNGKLVIRKEGESDRGYRFMVQGDDDISTRYARTFFKCVACKCLAYYTRYSGSSLTMRTFMDHEAHCKPFLLNETDFGGVESSENSEVEQVTSMDVTNETPTRRKRTYERRPSSAKTWPIDPPRRTPTPEVEPVEASYSTSCQMNYLLPELAPQQDVHFSRPSDAWIANSCRQLKIDQSTSDDPYGVWYRLKKLDLQAPGLPPIMDTKNFSSGFGLIAYLVAADEFKGDAVQQAISLYFINNYLNFGTVDGTDFSNMSFPAARVIFASPDIVPVHFVCVSQLLKCAVVLFDYTASKRFDFPAVVAEAPTIVVGLKAEGYFLFVR